MFRADKSIHFRVTSFKNDPVQASLQNLKVQKVVALISILLFAVKIWAWFLTNSIAILTDALESIVNVVAGLFGVYSLWVSSRPRDFEHPYGHGKVEFISAAIEGTLIFIAGIFIIFTAVKGLFEPATVVKLDAGMILLAVSALINWVAGSICVSVGRRNNSLALVASGKHLRTDVYTTLGIIVGLVLLYITRLIWIDSVVAIIFAMIILVTGYKIIRTSVAGIMDEADESLLKNMVEKFQQNRKPDWIDLHNLRVIKYGAILHLDCHMTVPWYYNVLEAHRVVDELSTLVRNNYGESMELFVHSDACMEFSCRICTMPDCPVRQHDFERLVTWTIHSMSENNKHNVYTT